MLITELTHIAVFDTETTGIDVENDRVVTAYIGLMDRDGNLIEKTEWLINPGIPIPDGAAAVHGVTTEMAVAGGIEPRRGIIEIVARLRELVERGIPIVAYNGRYDMTIMDREARRHGISPLLSFILIDPYVIDKATDKYRRGSRKLIDTSAHYGIVLENAHTADADAIAGGLLAWLLMEKAQGPAGTVEELHATQVIWAREQAVSLEAYFRTKARKARDANPDDETLQDPDKVYVEKVWPVALLPEDIEDELAFV